MGSPELAYALAFAVDRNKREECKRTKHDSQFSKWQVLVGQSDWEDYSLGKEGAHRYRVHNLLATSGPGLYELGITVSRSGLGRKADKLDSDGVVVVYLGQADIVKTRLQCYGRSGAHLNKANDGLGYFDDVFSRGHSIVYRWAPMKNKADALKTESKLLNTFDYAWNKGGNGTRRHDDVLRKLNKVSSNNIQFPKTVRKLLYFSQKPVGIKIKATKLPSERNKLSTDADDENHNFFSEIFKFSKSRPRLVLDKHGADEDCTSICEVSLGDGSICRRSPVEGRKRCSQHKGLRISGSNPVKLPVVVEKCPDGEGFSSIFGVVLDDGSLCRILSGQGNKRCEEHKWRKNNGSNSISTETSQYVHDVLLDSNACSASNSSEMYRPERVQPRVSSERSANKLHCDNRCRVELGDGTFCTRQPVNGRVRCEEHKGLKINGIKSKSTTQNKSLVYDVGSNFSTFDDGNYCSSVCGAQTLNGSYCRRPVKGNTRCWQHLKQAFDMGSTISSYKDRNYGRSSVCGAPTRGGSYCRRTVKSGGKCWQH